MLWPIKMLLTKPLPTKMSLVKMMPFNLFKAAIVMLLLIGVSACGFKLRGVDGVNLANHKIAIISETPYGDLEKSLQRQIRLNDGVVVSAGEDSDWQLKLSQLDIQQQGVSRDATGRANETLLHATLIYQIVPAKPSDKAMEPELIPLQTLKVTRNFYLEYRSPVSHQNQLNSSQAEIVQEMTRLLIRQLERVTR